MGLTCKKQYGKFQSLLRKVDNEIAKREEELKVLKGKKSEKIVKTDKSVK